MFNTLYCWLYFCAFLAGAGLLPQRVLPVSVRPGSDPQTRPDTVPVRYEDRDTSAYITVVRQSAPAYMTNTVAFVSDFINRLNYRRTPANQPMDAASQLVFVREPYLRALFDEDDVRIDPRSGRFSRAYKTAIDDFVTDVLGDTAAVFLPDAHQELFAEVTYELRYRKKLVPATLYLKLFEHNNAYDWKILDSDNSLPPANDSARTAVARTDSVPAPFIASQTHETRFQNLFGHLQKRRNLLLLMPRSQPVSPQMQALATALLDSSATVERTQGVHLYLNTRRNWVLRLDDFVRAKDNSGWLIADLYGGTATAVLPVPIDRYLNFRH